MKTTDGKALLEYASDLELLSSSLAAGLPLDEASAYLTRHGSPHHRARWLKLHSRLVAGLPLQSALHDFKVGSADAWSDQLCEIVMACEVYNSSLLSNEIIDQAAFMRQAGDLLVDAKRRLSAAKSIAWLALAAPWLLVLMLSSRTENRQVFLQPQGLAILAIGVVASALAFQISKRIATLPEMNRVFA